MGISRKHRILIPVGLFDVASSQDTYVGMYVRIFILVVEDQKKCAHMNTGAQVTDVCTGNTTCHWTGFIVGNYRLRTRQESSEHFILCRIIIYIILCAYLHILYITQGFKYYVHM